MSAWLVALVVWVAAGARVGRVLVRPATVIRMAIVVAVLAAAGAMTVAIPVVARAIDKAASGATGMNGAALSATLGTSMWIVFAGAMTAISIAAWTSALQPRLRTIAAITYFATALAAGAAVIWSVTIGWIVVAVAAVFVVITGLRNLNWSPLGRAIAIFTAATALVAVLAVLQVVDPPAHAPGTAPFATPAWAWSIAGMAVAVGSVWILVEVWIRAKLLLRRTRTLHGLLIDRFPEVVTNYGDRRTTTVLRASDHVANVMDALYLQSGGGVAPVRPTPPPASWKDRAAVVAKWVRDPATGASLDSKWVAPPEGMSVRRWVVAVGQAYAGGA